MTARSRENRPPRRTSSGLPDEGLSLVEEAEANPADARELAAARLALSVEHALGKAFELSRLGRTELAQRLDVSLSAVSQVLDSDGNLRISTIGRYARALGYQASLRLDPVSDGVAPLDLPAPANVAGRAGDTAIAVMTMTSGRVWAAETETVETTIDRIVFRTVCTSMHSENRPFPTGTATDPIMTGGVSA